MEQAAAPSPIIGQEYCLPQAAQFRVTKDDVTDSNGELVFQVHKKSSFSTTRRELHRDGRPVVLLERNKVAFRDRHFKGYAAPVFKGRDQPLWTVKPKTSFRNGISYHVFLSSNVNQQVPDYTIKGHSWSNFYKKYTIFLGENRLAAEVTREASKLFTRNYKYNVVVQPSMDTAFIFSLIIILDIESNEDNAAAASAAVTAPTPVTC